MSCNNQISMSVELVSTVSSVRRPVSSLVDIYLSTINPLDTSDGREMVDIPLAEYLSLTGHHARKPDYRSIDAALEELLNMRVVGDGEDIQLFELATRDVDIKASKVLRIKCSEAAEPLFFALGHGSQYISYRIGEVFGLSAQSYALFLFILCHAYPKKPVIVSKGQLINVLHLHGTSSHALIERIDFAVEQINKHTRYQLSFEKNKAKGGLVSLSFEVGFSEHWIAQKHIRDDWADSADTTTPSPNKSGTVAASVPKWAERVLIASQYHRLKKLSKDYLRKECCGVREPDDSDAEELVKTLLEEAQNRNVSHFHAYISKQLHSMLQQIVSPATVQPKVNKSTQYLKHGELSPMMRQAIQKALESESDLEQASVSDLNQDN